MRSFPSTEACSFNFNTRSQLELESKMDKCHRVFLVVFLLRAVSSADNQAPCCYPKQFTALQESLDTFLDNGTIVTVEGATRMAYDAINEKVAEITDAYNDVTGVTVKTKIIYDYKLAKKYIIQGRECTVETLTHPFSETCMPSIAKFDTALGTGLGKAIPIHTYNFLVPGSTPNPNILVQYAVGAEGCTPIQVDLIATKEVPKQTPKLAAVGQLMPTDPLYKWVNSTAPGATQKLTSSYQYSDYEEGIKPDPSFWFDPPSGCKRGEKAPPPKQPRASFILRRRRRHRAQ